MDGRRDGDTRGMEGREIEKKQRPTYFERPMRRRNVARRVFVSVLVSLADVPRVSLLWSGEVARLLNGRARITLAATRCAAEEPRARFVRHFREFGPT